MNPFDYQVFIISSLKRGYQPKDVAHCLGVPTNKVQSCLQVYRNKYQASSTRQLVDYFGGYMSRCEYCKHPHGQLLPVIVTSRGKQYHSWSHYKCATKWRKIADVKFDESGMTEKEASVLNGYRSRSLSLIRHRRSQVSKNCIDCGYPIDPESERCLSCAGAKRSEEYWQTYTPNRCVCGEEITRTAKYCPQCSAIVREIPV